MLLGLSRVDDKQINCHPEMKWINLTFRWIAAVKWSKSGGKEKNRNWFRSFFFLLLQLDFILMMWRWYLSVTCWLGSFRGCPVPGKCALWANRNSTDAPFPSARTNYPSATDSTRRAEANRPSRSRSRCPKKIRSGKTQTKMLFNLGISSIQFNSYH